MGMLAAFAGGASSGVQDHWAAMRDKAKEEAQRAFQERIADKRYDRLRAAQLADRKDSREYKEDQIKAQREYQESQAKKERELMLKDEQRKIEQEKSLKKWGWDNKPREPQPLSLSEVYVIGPDGQSMRQKIDTRTGQLVGDAIPAYKPSSRDGSSSRGGMADGFYFEDFESNIPGLDGETGKKANVKIDYNSGIAINPTGDLLKPSITREQARQQAEIDLKNLKDKNKLLDFKSDRDFVGGTDEEYLEERTAQLVSESPTVAETYGLDPRKVFRSIQEAQNADLTQAGGSQPASYVEPPQFSEPDQPSEPDQSSESPQPGGMLSEAERGPQEAEPQPNALTAEEQALLDEYGLNQPTPELNKMPPNIYKDVDLAGTIRKNAPLLSKLGDKVGEQIPRSIDAYTGLLGGIPDFLARQHREAVASGEKMREADRKRMVERLTSDFFNGKPSIDAARIVLDNDDVTERQKGAARAYLKAKGVN